MSESLLPSSADLARQLLTQPGRGMEALRGRAKRGGDPRALWEASQEFESILLNELIRVMRKTVPKSKLFHGGLAEDVYRSFLDQEIARRASRVQGFGLAPAIYRQLGGELLAPGQQAGAETPALSEARPPLPVTPSRPPEAPRAEGAARGLVASPPAEEKKR